MGNLSFACSGEIEILKQGEGKVYVIWRMFDKNKSNIASVSREHYFGEDEITGEKLLNRIREDIKSYRIGRKRIFFKVDIPSNFM